MDDDNFLTTTNNPSSLAQTDEQRITELSALNEQPGQTSSNFNFATSSTASQVTAPSGSFSVSVPDSLTSDSLAGDTTASDVMSARDTFEQELAAPTATSQMDEIEATEEVSFRPFDDPEAEIRDILNRDETEAEQLRAEILREQAEATGGIASGLERAEQRAESKVGLTDLEKQLGDTREKIARRSARFRRELRAMKEDPRRRGVARAFFQDDLAKLEADATAELADLYIIENALSGNVERAQQYIQTAVENKYRAFEIETAQRQADLAALIPTLEGEEKERALRLQLSLNQRQMNLEEKKAQESAIRELLITVAQNGGDENAQRAVLNSGSVDEAIIAAGPYIGLLERQAAQRAASSAALQRKKTLIELAKMGDKDALAELGSLGQAILQEQSDAQLLADYQKNLAITDEISNLDLLNDKALAAASNEVGKGLATGTFTSPAGAAYGTAIPSGAAAGFAAGSVVPGLGNVVGTGIGILSGIGVGTVNYAKNKNAKEDFLNDVNFISQNIAFDKFIDLKSQGVAFGGTSNAELKKIDSAASALSASIITDPATGTPIRISGSEQAFTENLKIVTDGIALAKSELQKSRLSDEEQAALLRYLTSGQ